MSNKEWDLISYNQSEEQRLNEEKLTPGIELFSDELSNSSSLHETPVAQEGVSYPGDDN